METGEKSRWPAAVDLRRFLATELGLLALAGLARAQDGECVRAGSLSSSLRAMTFEGLVLGPNGGPVDGAVVVSSAGGRAVTDRSGAFTLAVVLPPDADEACLTAIAGNGQGSSARLALAGTSQRVSVAPLVLQGTCSPQWLPTFGAQPGMDGDVSALAVFDDGTGPALYAGGGFDVAGAGAASEIARWDGAAWVPVGSGITNGFVYALTVFDDGSGPALYVGGGFAQVAGLAVNGIARWDGTTWSSLGSGFAGSLGAAKAMTVFDDGSGPALHVTGYFTSVDGVPANYVAKWDGAAWSALGSGLDGPGAALTTWDDGNGPALCIGGDFLQAGGTSASAIASWNGTVWSSLGGGVGGVSPFVAALAVFDDGNGVALHAGGTFTSAGGIPASRIARWNGASWSALGSGVNDSVVSLVTHDDGGGAALHVGGRFTSAGGTAVEQLAKWDGTAWSAPGDMGGPPLLLVSALASFDDGGGARLVAAGWFVDSRVILTSRIASWDGVSWATLGRGLDDAVRAFAWFDDGGGTALHVGGSFFSAGETTLNGIGRWDGAGWSSLAGGVNGDVEALAVYDDGTGAAL
jgi:hypothetical protein